MKKTIATLALVGTLAFTGCDDLKYSSREKTQDNHPSTSEKYSFTSFGEIAHISGTLGRTYGHISQLRTADIDEDGDEDIIIGMDDGRVIVYRNDMVNKRR